MGVKSRYIEERRVIHSPQMRFKKKIYRKGPRWEVSGLVEFSDPISARARPSDDSRRRREGRDLLAEAQADSRKHS